MVISPSIGSRLRAAVCSAALGLALAWTPLAPAGAQGVLDGLSAAGAAKLSDPAAFARALDRAAAGRVRVIVTFAPPALPEGVASGTLAADRITTTGVRAVQDRILDRLFAAEGPSPTAAEADLGLRRFDYTPGFALSADPALLAALAADPEVLRIDLDVAEPPSLTRSLPLIGMPAAVASGATGSGQVVAVLDTGARVSHEFLAGRIVEEACYNTIDTTVGSTSRCPGGAAASTATGSANDCTSASVTGCGHGTHVAGIAAGRLASPLPGNPSMGAARDGRLFVINVFAQFPATQCDGVNACVLSWVSDQIAGLERVYARRFAHNIAAVNMSLGGGRHYSACTTESRRAIIQQLTAAGIAVVVAAGNNGWSDSVNSPACIPEAIAVGNTTLADGRTSSSNWSSQVEIAAPGQFILASYINGSSNTYYAELTGTSMAAPHVAGLIAGLRTAMPAATVAQIRTALFETGVPVTASGTTIPRVNADLGLARLRSTTGIATTATVTGAASSSQGQSVNFTAQVGASSGTPAGMVTFTRNGVSFGSAALNGSGVATLATSALPIGSHQIRAVYLGSGTHRSATSAAITHVVAAPGAPVNDMFANRITIASAGGTVTGTNVNATRETGEPATIATRTSTRSVWWRYTPAVAGTVVIDTNGSGFDTILGVYTGSAVNALTVVAENDDSPEYGLRSRVQFPVSAGTSYAIAVAGFGTAEGNITLNVALTPSGPAATATTLAGPASGTFGQSLSFTATVTSPGGTPAGTVSFRRGGAQFATATLNGAGQAVASTAALPVGPHQITAHFLATPAFAASASAGRTVTISRAATTTTLAGPASGESGQTLAFTATVTSPGGTPAGTVSFRRGGAQFATGTLGAGGTATVSVSSFPDGVHQITAHYLQSANFAASASAARTVTIGPRTAAYFAGGGAVFGFTDACRPAWPNPSEAVRVRYVPAELNGGPPSELSIFWPAGSEQLTLAGNMVVSTNFLGGAGRQIWSYFVFYPLRPLLRIAQRLVTQPAGGTIAQAAELALRVRVQNFGALPGCTAVVHAILRRE